tara:strand:- start:1213 stop:1557 length:345 start_codon:yes stop_codon:yes gene_type:complete
MSLKITNATGFVIGGVLNPSVTEVYVRCNVDMSKQKLVDDDFVSIKTFTKCTVLGGLFDDAIQIGGVSPLYWLNYATDVTDMNEQYLEIETDLKTKLEAVDPSWAIEIVTIGVA